MERTTVSAAVPAVLLGRASRIQRILHPHIGRPAIGCHPWREGGVAVPYLTAATTWADIDLKARFAGIVIDSVRDPQCGAAAATTTARTAAAAAAQHKHLLDRDVRLRRDVRIAPCAVDRVGEHIDVFVLRTLYLVPVIAAVGDEGHGVLVVRRSTCALVHIVRCPGNPRVRVGPVRHGSEHGQRTRLAGPLRKLQIVHHHIRARIALVPANGDLDVVRQRRRMGREHHIRQHIARETQFQAGILPVRRAATRGIPQIQLLVERHRADAIGISTEIILAVQAVRALVKGRHPPFHR